MSTVVTANPNPYAPPRAKVHDVAVPRAAVVLAERSSRLGAAIVDALIFAVMVYVPMGIGIAMGRAGADSDNAAGPVLLLIGLTLMGFIVWVWLTLRQMKATGQSLAKKRFNIKVVLSDGSPVSLSTLIWKRNVLTWLLSFLPLYSIIEVLFIFGEKRQCLHDRIADTIVVEA
jgi:uncharacterized RDD family membrane protein YckC